VGIRGKMKERGHKRDMINWWWRSFLLWHYFRRQWKVCNRDETRRVDDLADVQVCFVGELHKEQFIK
jgi:hypothetical protein